MNPTRSVLAALRPLSSRTPRLAFGNAVAGPSRLPHRSLFHQSRNLDGRFFWSGVERDEVTRLPSPLKAAPVSVSVDPLSQRSRRLLRRARLAPLLAALPVTVVSDTPDPTTWYQPLSDLLVSSPLPLGATIILLTFALRGTLTFPVTYLVRKQAERAQRQIKADVYRWVDERKDGWFRQAKAEKLKPEDFVKRMDKLVAPYHQESIRRYRQHPFITSLVPLMINVPILVVFSIVIRNALAPGSEAALQSFSFIPQLGEPEPLLSTIGLLFGVGTSQLLYRMPKAKSLELDPSKIYSRAAPERGPPLSALGPGLRAVRERERLAREQRRSLSTAGADKAASTTDSTAEPPTTPEATPATRDLPWYRRSDPLSPELRGMTFMFMQLGGTVLYTWISCFVPAGLALYWLSSMAFSFCQTGYFFLRAWRRTRAEQT